jgi:hypothetical protein
VTETKKVLLLPQQDKYTHGQRKDDVVTDNNSTTQSTSTGTTSPSAPADLFQYVLLDANKKKL